MNDLRGHPASRQESAHDLLVGLRARLQTQLAGPLTDPDAWILLVFVLAVIVIYGIPVDPANRKHVPDYNTCSEVSALVCVRIFVRPVTSALRPSVSAHRKAPPSPRRIVTHLHTLAGRVITRKLRDAIRESPVRLWQKPGLREG